ncbi:GL24426 [Drosophila persimilis]|uniref:GL24426 n=1 Tax=Drosophila persimilis TaxID=7234 RepID=B4G5T0_DROPE|nr:kanadaptin [Drosophila persimilis]EDW24946.1 GL24426 [Drosophila persimilis]
MDEFKVPAPLPKYKPTVVENPLWLQIETTEEPANSRNIIPAICPYKVPRWSAPPPADQTYKFEVLKSGQIIDEVRQLQQQAIWTFGRLPENDVSAAHPTISRFHAVLQYKPKPSHDHHYEDEEHHSEKPAKNDRPEGWYIYDLDSTHGTYLNKQRVPSKVYIRMRVGHMLKLGGSSRIYILQGPNADAEPESELSISELREKREREVAAAAAEKQRKIVEEQERERNDGVSWGMGEDADEETDLTHNPFASFNNDDLFFDDPKKTLRGFFEREGLNLEYKCDELSQGSFVCRVELPLDDFNGRPIMIEVNHKGRKKDCVVQCALEACRTLDKHGVLRQANQEAQKRKILKAGDSDDEDEFWDRTGDVARKKQRKATAGSNGPLTYEDLLKQQTDLLSELGKVEFEIATYQLKEKRAKEEATKQLSASYDLDNFMNSLSVDIWHVDKTEIKKLRLELQRIKGEQQKVQRLIQIAKPACLPYTTSSATATITSASQEGNNGAKKQLPMIGKRNQFSKFKVVTALPSSRATVQSNAFAPDEEEIEEEEVKGKQAKLAKEMETVAKPSTLQNENLPESKPTAEAAVAAPQAAPKPTTSEEAVVQQEYNFLSTSVLSEVATFPTELFLAFPLTEAIDDISTLTATTQEESPDDAAAQKKRRQRAPRQRNNKQRQDVDMDMNELVEHEDTEKYAKWVPPTNQSGDGITHLNEKFGY